MRLQGRHAGTGPCSQAAKLPTASAPSRLASVTPADKPGVLFHEAGLFPTRVRTYIHSLILAVAGAQPATGASASGLA